MKERSLLEYTRAAGCAAKVCQEDLAQVLSRLPAFRHPDLLVGGDTADDAGVYRLDSERALVMTIDIMTPVAENPRIFGQVAAANAFSDVYAMGGVPFAALSFVAYPVLEIQAGTIQAILAGAWDKAREAGAVVVGGHTIKDVEVKFGLAAIGLVHPDRVIRNVGARPGDVLVLTKPLGTGVITTALRAGIAPPAAVAEVNRSMCRLNRAAAEVMCRVGVSAATDVTGFGLLGHAWEMAQAGDIDLVIDAAAVPLFPGVEELARQGWFPDGSVKNYGFIATRADFAEPVPDELRRLLCDAQTSGGLLVAVAPERAERFVDSLRAAGVRKATAIGRVTSGSGRVVVS
ncbi:selenide, water dikinase SelD [candidate division WOR-3 bacterium]|nr:selenide, water dikinase SelD [candidate division WOR-3 bacterium]